MPVQFPYPETPWSEGFMRKAKGKAQPPPMDITRMGGQAKGGGEDISRWERMPKSTNVEDIRGQEPPKREPGEIMAHWGGDQKYTYQHHYANLLQGGVKQSDDSTSTFRSITVQIGKQHYVLPTIWDNKQVSNEEAVKKAKEIGLDNFISSSDRKRAEASYEQVHKFMMEDLTNPRSPIGMIQGSK